MNKNSVTEEELIKKIQELRQIQPRKDWVVLTKSQILGEEQKIKLTPFSLIDGLRLFFQYQYKPALVGVLSILILFGTFTFARNSLPGDLLYPIKRIAEKSQAIFVSENEKPQASLELANKRLEELTKITETNQVKKIDPAGNEFEAGVSEGAKMLSRVRLAY